MKKNILIVDDDIQLNAFLVRILAKHDFQTVTATTAAEARLLLRDFEFSMIILDLNLPDADGLEIARSVEQTSKTPMIMLTARTEVYDRILGLELGADDYLTKPFEPRELLARIKAVMRRIPETEPAEAEKSVQASETVFSEFVLKSTERQLLDTASNDFIPLTNTEYVLLETLVERAGSVTPRKVIMKRIYGNNVNVTDRAIDAHIARLRKKIDRDRAGTSLIRAVHGEGYLLAATTSTD